MTSEQFDQLVNRIQAKYGSRPLMLRLRIALLVGLGYSGFVALLLIVLALATVLAIGALVADQAPSVILVALVAVLLAIGLWQTLVVLWVPMEAEESRDVSREESPRLFELLDTLQAELRVAPFDHVRITPEFNASVQMIPRLGVFGFHRRLLYLGLPLMLILSSDQFGAVLAHELAHCSSRHDRFGMWIYRLRLTWLRVFSKLHDPLPQGTIKSLRSLLLKFVDWYWPRFNAHAFVLSRANEYEADRVAAEWASGRVMAEALVRIDCVGNRLDERFWVDVTQLAKRESTVPDDILDRLELFLRHAPETADASRWLRHSAQKLTGNVDTHPSLSDRLASLGQSVDQFVQAGFPDLPSRSAADHFLGTALPTIKHDVNRLWQKENTLRWQNVFHQARRLEKQLEIASKTTSDAATIDERQNADEQPLDVDQVWQQAKTVGELQGVHAAEPLLRQLLAFRPTHSQANVMLGCHLLEQGRDEGEEFLRRILKEDDDHLIPAACHGLMTYFQQLGQLEKVREVRSHLSRFETAQVAAAKERSTVTPADTFVPHGLSDVELESLLNTLAQQPNLAAAWLVRKELHHFRKQRLFVLIVHSQPTGLFGSTNADRDRALVATLLDQVKLSGRVLIVAPQGGFRPLARKIMRQRNAQIVPSNVGSSAIADS